MSKQVPVDPSARADGEAHEGVHEVGPDIAYQRLAIVNVVLFGARDAGDRGWVLVDAGVGGVGAAGAIARAAASRFGGEGARPAAIVMTHGHFDHVGALEELADRWDVPVYAHELELPYLNGRRSYPPPDPGVGGGAMARMSAMYPRGPVDVGSRLHTLPADGGVPGMPGWRWIHTPGHTPGHVSLWRATDRTLISGDAVITTNQESAYAVMLQKTELHGPPMYYTTDWESARESVRGIAALEPEVLVSMHGRPLRGPAMREALSTLARDFDRLAVPERGRYVGEATRTDVS